MYELIGAVFVLGVARAWLGPFGLVLAILGLSAAWLVSRLFWPYKPCRRCKASGRNRGSNQRRHGNCRRCKGTRRIRRLGARQVHRAVLTIRNHVRNPKEQDHV